MRFPIGIWNRIRIQIRFGSEPHQTGMATSNPTITQLRQDAHLAKKFRWPDGQVRTLRDQITSLVGSGQARITYRHGTGPKRDGMRLPTRPVWTLWVGDSGVDISKTGACLAASLLNISLDEMESQGDKAYRKELAECR